jgi:hypothetical protein
MSIVAMRTTTSGILKKWSQTVNPDNTFGWLMYLGPKVQHYADEIASNPHNYDLRDRLFAWYDPDTNQYRANR